MSTRSLRYLAVAAKVVALTVVLVVVQGVGARFLPAAQGTAQQPPEPSTGFLTIVLAVSLLQTVALAYPTSRSRWHGWALVATVFILYFGTVTFLSQVESMVYLGAHLPAGMLRGMFLMGLFNAAAFSPILVLVLGKWRHGRNPVEESAVRIPLPWRTWAWRLVASGAVFTSLYYLFGYYVAWKDPVVRAYYGGTDPGSFVAQMQGIVQDVPWMLPFQFARGLVWTLLAVLVIQMMAARWWEAGLAVSLLFVVPTAYLLFPNPIMPDAVRMAHFIETAPYQFMFGWFAAWLFASAVAVARPRDADYSAP